MTKLKVPLLSFDARGRLTELFALAKRRGCHILEGMPIPTDAKSPNQLFYRHMFTKCADLWHTLSEAEQQDWESLARPRHMTGYAWFISQCLRPNPGIYLPLQGGTMSGDIDMAKNRVLKLPLPTDSQEPLTLAFFTANIAPYLYTERARVFHNVNQSVPDSTLFYLAFNSDRWDTDAMHDPVTNNQRLTCNTPGFYLIGGNVHIDGYYVGLRLARIYLNGRVIGEARQEGCTTSTNVLCVATEYQMAVNDYVTLAVWQNSGNTVPVFASNSHSYSCEFWIQRVG